MKALQKICKTQCINLVSEVKKEQKKLDERVRLLFDYEQDMMHL